MLIRFVIDNFKSYGTQTEFNMIPSRKQELGFHRYIFSQNAVLKQASIYGANASGKSNLIEALKLVKGFVLGNVQVFSQLTSSRCKLSKETAERNQKFVVEFLTHGKAYIYGLELSDTEIVTEELYVSMFGSSRKKDKLVFERKKNGFRVGPKTIGNLQNAYLKILETTLEDTPLQSLLLPFAKGKSFLTIGEDCQAAYEWFADCLQVFDKGEAAHHAFLCRIVADTDFLEYSRRLCRSLNLGIDDVLVKLVPIKEYFGQDDIVALNAALKQHGGASSFTFQGVSVVLAEDRYIVPQLVFLHHGHEFSQLEESAGTRNIIDLFPVLYSLLRYPYVVVIDEIECNIHPMLIKELIAKFSLDESTQGQLIFSTHETNLLDQDIFRPDEIWFTEKKADGCTDLYSLSAFQVHHTIDIRRGYFAGRYGAIPFLGNLRDLNWMDFP